MWWSDAGSVVAQSSKTQKVPYPMGKRDLLDVGLTSQRLVGETFRLASHAMLAAPANRAV